MDSMMWSGNLTHPFELNPEGRSWHSLTFITDTRAIVYGGLNQYNIVLNDCWLLTLHSEGMDHEWQEFELSYDHGEPRCSHTACLFPATGELLIHSGSTQPFYETRLKLKDHAEELLVIHFTPKSLLRLCLDVVVTYEKKLRSEWWSVPANLQKVLRDRLQQF
ncbi:Kelch domain-containing protein 1 [Zootermopsis nevadensis]|uniref:Kelch domain-containing protein 1 n=2 Tax=Zootermopsis nevadensis TaxID=136037 RepID=A0A067QMU2_ZOONE|nr:Kelch domain-containing protein 1 [Zootermopsis nevadensis]